MSDTICKYCHADSEGYRLRLPTEKHTINLAIDYFHVTGWCIENKNGQVRLKINFCPMCGRELKKEE